MESQVIYLRLCLDGSDKQDLRKRHRAERQLWLASPPSKILEAGPLFKDDGCEDYAGTMMLIEAESREAVLALHDDDPFTKAGIYEQVVIMPYQKRVG